MAYFTLHKPLFLVPPPWDEEELQKVDLLFTILEESGVAQIIKKNTEKDDYRGRKRYNPYNMFAMIVYCYAMHSRSLRDMETMCKYDLRVIQIMNEERPSYKAICDYINTIILPDLYDIFAQVTAAIVRRFEIDINDHYIDGTKIEANANKYKFVWKPVTFHKKLNKKIQKYLEDIGHAYHTDTIMIPSKFLYSALQDYAAKHSINPEEIPEGKGTRRTPEQRVYKQGNEYLLKLLDYEEKESICGENRNSFYKTDHDATAMALKTDYYSGHGTNMHAAYNIQIDVSSGLIMMFGVFQDRSDYHTFIPLLEKYHELYKSFPRNICADSGYGIYKNYIYLRRNHIGNYVKYQQWNGESTGKRPQLFHYDEEYDSFYCLNGKCGRNIGFSKARHPKYKDSDLYEFSGCTSCGYEYICRKSIKDRTVDIRQIELIKEYEILKSEARGNLVSPKGIEIRVNRSIQVEGTFGQLKQNMQYLRIRRRGINKVRVEIMLMCMGRNIRKMFTYKTGARIQSEYWKLHDKEQHEKFPLPKEKGPSRP